MNRLLKIGLYVLLAAGVSLCATQFFKNFQTNTATPIVHEEENPPVTDTNTDSTASTNSSTTNVAGKTDETAKTNPPPVIKADATTREAVHPVRSNSGRMIAYGGAAVLFLVLLGAMIAWDLSQLFANKTEEFLFNDEGSGLASPEYEEAEKVWANGDPLEAIRLMRDYLAKNPREQYVAIRIAEIYEKDLHNYLAAALEYEEILKKKLPPERWGWAAIHLANLYSGKLNRTEQALALLRKIDQNYGQTAAAEKARKRLAMYETGEAPVE